MAGSLYAFLQQKDCSYKLLKKVEKETRESVRDSLTAKYNRSIKSAETENDLMEARVKRIE